MDDRLLRDLDRYMPGKYLTGEPARDSVKQRLWSAIASSDTIAAIECHSAADVQTAVRIAADHDLDVSSLGGGHDWVGRSVTRTGITLDLRPMDRAIYDADRSLMTAGGGALAGTVLACMPRHRAVVTGVSKDVGLTGLALGGGYGKLNSRFGLVTDTLQRIEVVLADGTMVHASQEENADLFWAMRGGGKNFCVVTSADYSTFAVDDVLTGKIFLPLAKAGTGLKAVQDALDAEGEFLSIFSSFQAVPDLGFGLVLEPLWTGRASEGEKRFDMISGQDGAVVLQRTWCPYAQVPDGDGGAPNNVCYQMDAYNIARFSGQFCKAVTDCASRSPSQQNTIMFHDFHGAAAEVANDVTSFSFRENHYNMQVVASWASGDAKGETDAKVWLQEIRQQVEPLSIRGGYPAVLPLDSHNRARAFYGPALDRLRRLKAQYDPDDRFSARFGLY